ncbi:MAG: helix-turn-helix domain-containing protein [Thermoanaerobaculia bacterium]
MLQERLLSRPRPGTVEFHHRAVERVVDAMRIRLEETLSLEEMAEIAIMSPFHFNRVFRRLTGVPPCQFLSALRLEKAKRLLLTTDISVTDICFQVGYNSLGTFTRRFTELVGLSPQRLRALSTFDAAHLAGTFRHAHLCSQGDDSASTAGRIVVPAGFSGLIFVGVFSSPVPQGRPIACTVMGAPGPCRMPRVPEGRNYLFAAALDLSSSHPNDYFLYENVLRGGMQGGAHPGSGGELFLRPADPIDPPILLTFPLLVEAFCSRQTRTCNTRSSLDGESNRDWLDHDLRQ